MRGELSYLPGHNPEPVHIAGLGGVHGINHIRRRAWPIQFWRVATGKLAGVSPILCCADSRVGENICIAKAGDPGSAVFVDEDVCLRYETGVSCMPLVWEGGMAYRLEVSVDDAQVVYVLQTSSYSY